MGAIIIGILTPILPVFDILYQVFRDKLSTDGRIRQTRETLAALDTIDQTKITPSEDQMWSRSKELQQKKLRKELKNRDSAKDLRVAWASFGFFALLTLGFSVCCFVYGIQKGEWLTGNVVVAIVKYLLAVVFASFLVVLCRVTWHNVWDIKISNGVLTKEEMAQVVADMNSGRNRGNASDES